jgi:hypothetical protein
MDRGFIPSREGIEVAHGGVLGIDDLYQELLDAMRFKPSTHQLEVGLAVPITGRRAVNCDQTASFPDKLEESFFLFGTEFANIVVNENSVVIGEIRIGPDRVILGVDPLDSNRPQYRFDHLPALCGKVAILISQKKDSQGRSLGGGTRERSE